MSDANPMRQSNANNKTMQAAGAAIFEGISGIKCAIASSNFATLSTMRFLYTPDGVSSMTPIGTFRIFSAIAHRILHKMVNAILWLRLDATIPSRVLRMIPAAAIPAQISVLCIVAVPAKTSLASMAAVK